MPKLIHKDKITRLKKHNYTEKHDLLAKKLSENPLKYQNLTHLMKAAGYSDTESPDNRRGVAEVVRAMVPVDRRVRKLDTIMEEGEDNTVLKAIDILNKMDGSYAATKIEGDLVSKNIDVNNIDSDDKANAIRDALKQLTSQEDSE